MSPGWTILCTMDETRKTRIGTGIGAGITILLTGALAFGGYSFFHNAGQGAGAEAATYTGPVATSVAPPPQDDAAAQAIYDQQIAQAKAEADAAAAAQAAAAAAAAQAAADAARRAAAPKSVTPVKCPAGSQANSGDGGNDTSCFPEICFHIVLPDPAHPECVTAFKP